MQFEQVNHLLTGYARAIFFSADIVDGRIDPKGKQIGKMIEGEIRTGTFVGFGR